MTTLTQHRSDGYIDQPQTITRGLLDRFRALRARRRTYRETMDVLAQLNDRDLRDLGINRYDLDAIARGTYHH